jgi:hypothetical protein
MKAQELVIFLRTYYLLLEIVENWEILQWKWWLWRNIWIMYLKRSLETFKINDEF